LARNRRILREQQRQVLHDLSNAVADVDRSYENSKTAYNLLVASENQLNSIQAAYDAGETSLFILLDVQRRLAQARIGFDRSCVEYALAIRNVHFEKGSLLDYNHVYLSEGPSGVRPACTAEHSARRLDHMQSHPILNYTYAYPRSVSVGPYPQQVIPDEQAEVIPLPALEAEKPLEEIPFPLPTP
jgi:hypothetical protein